jgi:hypothetical protein
LTFLDVSPFLPHYPPSLEQTGAGTVAIAISRYRSQATDMWTATKEAALGIVPSLIFFSGLAFHVMTALLAHITGYDMQWAATKKDLETPTIQEEIPVVFKRHWLTWLLSILTIAGVVICSSTVLPLQWRIEQGTITLPILWLAVGQFVLFSLPFFPFSVLMVPSCPFSAVYPILLNPAIMLFRF